MSSIIMILGEAMHINIQVSQIRFFLEFPVSDSPHGM